MKFKAFRIILPQKFICAKTFSRSIVKEKTRNLQLLTALFVLLVNAVISTAQTNINVTQIATLTDFSRPAHTRWNNQTGGEALSGMPAAKLYYRRYSWADLEGNTAGAWRFDERVRPDVQAAINAGAMFNPGIMTLYPDGGNSFNNTNTVNGMSCTYPTYVHNQMQSTGTPDFNDGGSWIPNYNHSYYLARLDSLHTNFRKWWETATYTPSSGPRAGQLVHFKNVLAIYDVRLCGSYGESHHGNQNAPYNVIANWPAGRFPTVATFKKIIDIQVDAFDDYPCTVIINSFDGEWLPHTMIPVEIGHYILTKTNNFGKIGIRRDQWGDPATYYADITINSPHVFGGVEFDTACQNRYKYAPITGEPINNIATNGNCQNLPQQFRSFHTYGMGNGNYSGTLPSGTCLDSVLSAFRIQGSRCTVIGGSMTTTLTQNASFNVTLNYRNIGLTPEYWKWQTIYELRNQSTGAVAATFNSAFTPQFFLPAVSATAYNENFNLGNVTPGTYRLVAKIIDPTGYREPYPLGITGREPDGAYQLRNNIIVQAGGNQAPTANAGTDKAIQLPTSSVTLTGSGTDPDGTIITYAWSKFSGGAATIVSPSSATTNITGLVQGSYTFRLTVTDNMGATGTDDVLVTVSPTNVAPTANAGTDKAIQLPTNSVILTGSGTDPDGTITTYAWSKVSGGAATIVSPSSATTNITGLVQGSYTFRLTVTDNLGAIGTDDVLVTVSPAGSNKVYLTWETPIDADYEQFNSNMGIRKLSSSPWSTNSGTVTAIQTLDPGDELVAQLYLATNSWAIGLSKTKPLPYVFNEPTGNNNAVFGYVVAIDGNNLQAYQAGAGVGTQRAMSNFQWVKTVYSSSQQITYSTASASTGPWTTLYTSAVVPSGSYYIIFQGIGNGAGPNEIYVLEAAANQPPTANAGTDKAIQLPTSSVTLTGSGTDPDGTITTYAWSKVSGGAATIVSPSSATTNITGLVQGSYTFRLTVTDNQGAIGTDDVLVTVSPANVAPTANAGTDKAIQLPTNSVTLTGSGTDPDGTITTYAWSKVSGGAATIVSPSSATTNITGLVQGSYTFRLTVTDNQGATGTDNVLVTVSPANVAPTANAGTDKAIQLPTNSVTLTGSGTDPDGTITTYAWSKVSGGAATIVSPSSATTNITGLVQGPYTFRLTVTDNLGATGTDDVLVTVSPAGSNKIYLTWETPIDADYEQFNSNMGIRKLSSSPWSTNSGTVTAIQTLDPGDELVAQLYLATNSWAIGLSKTKPLPYVFNEPTGNNNAVFGYVVAIDGNNLQAYQAGAGVGTQRAMSNFQWVKIVYSSSQQITYSTASASTGPWTTLYTSAVVPSGSYYIIFQGIGNGAGPNEIYVNKGGAGSKMRPVTQKDILPTLDPTGVNLIPNPVSSILKISINSGVQPGKSSVRIYTQQGQIVYQKQFLRSQRKLIMEVDVSKYTAGIYYVHVNEGKNTSVILKFIKD